MTVNIDLGPLKGYQVAQLGLAAGLVRRREAGTLAARIASALRAACDQEERRRIARAVPRMYSVPIEIDQDAAPAAVDREIHDALLTVVTLRDSQGTQDPAREVWNVIASALAALRDQRAARRHEVVDLLYPHRTIPDEAA